MKRLLPKTLFGRMVLIMIAGLVISQILTTIIFFQERERFGLRTAARHFGLQMAQIIKILDSRPVTEQAGIVELISGPDLTVSLSAMAKEMAKEMASGMSRNDGVADSIVTALNKYLGDVRPIRVWLIDKSVDASNSEEVDAKTLLVQARLRGNSWVNFKFSINEPPNVLVSPRFLLSMLVRLITVIILALLAVRLVARPLQTLASAAEDLGRDIHRPPLEEIGPLEVQRAASAFNTMQRRLIDYIQERTRILAAVSHDLRTPITRLRLRTELLDESEVRAKFINDLEEMESMVSATLDFTRSVDKTASRRDIDVMALLESLQADAQELGYDVEIFGSALETAKADPQSLKSCIANLLDNAWKYGKHARIIVNDSENELRISVCDDGPGIPEKEIEKVFEPFYRVEGSRSRSTGGVGLGLSIARNAARANGGNLVLRNRQEGGLEATLLLPRLA
ncbi:MAG: ATP-binding protein [Pseudomonadota bacterium]